MIYYIDIKYYLAYFPCVRSKYNQNVHFENTIKSENLAFTSNSLITEATKIALIF